MIYLLLFVLAFSIFYASPILKIGDSWYTMLLGEHLLLKKRFSLNEYFWPNVDSSKYPPWVEPVTMLPRHIQSLEEHLYYSYPFGTSLLTVPLIAVMRLTGVSTISENGQYNPRGEEQMQKFAAAFLMALACVVFFSTARLLLNDLWSILIALAGCFGSQVWGTAS